MSLAYYWVILIGVFERVPFWPYGRSASTFKKVNVPEYKVGSESKSVFWFGRPISKRAKYAHIIFLAGDKDNKACYFIAVVINHKYSEFANRNIILDYKDPAIIGDMEDNFIFEHYTMEVDESLNVHHAYSGLTLTRNFKSPKLNDETFISEVFKKKFTSQENTVGGLGFIKHLEGECTEITYPDASLISFVTLQLPPKFDVNTDETWYRSCKF